MTRLYLADWRIGLTWSKEELHWSNHQLVERRCQLKTVLEKCNTSENIKTEASSRHSDNQTSDVTNNTSSNTPLTDTSKYTYKYKYTRYGAFAG